MKRAFWFWRTAAVGALLAVALLGGVVPSSGVAATSALQSKFVPAGPIRVMDTRTTLPFVPGRGSSEVLGIGGSNGVPASATAVVLNVTITESIGSGYVQLFPTGRGTPGASSNLNVPGPGSTIANLVIVPLGDNGQVSFFNHAGGHLVADLFGYFVTADRSADGRFVGLDAPDRVLDTRDPREVPIENPGDARNCSDFSTWAQANTWYWTYARHGDIANLDGDGNRIPCESLSGNPGRVVIPADLFKLDSGETYQLPVRTNASPAGGVLPAASSAVVMNVTVTQSSRAGYLQVFNNNADKTKSSNLNYQAGDTAPNLVIAPIAADGTVKIFVQGGTHVVVDIVGYFTNSSASSSTAGLFVPVSPDRLVNTRDEGGVRPKGTLRTVDVASLAGLTAGEVGAMFMNATLTDSLGAGYLQIYPTGRSTPGASSNVNVTGPDQIRPNAAITGVASGDITVHLQAGGNFILDAAGYFLAAGTASGGGTENGGSLISRDAVRPGGTLVVAASGFRASSSVRIELHSEPVLLEALSASGQGSIETEVTIPADTPPGDHTIVVQGVDPNNTELIQTQSVSIDAVGPVIAELSVSSSSVSPGGSFTITARVQDPSGVESAGVWFELGGAQRDFCGQSLSRSGGTATDGTWTLECEVPSVVQGGTYTVVPYAVDVVGNWTNTNCCSFSSTRATFTVVGGSDDAVGPVIAELSVSSSSVSPGGSFTIT
ncbi:MAG: hypothetical protein ACO225_15210, partial [Ilumatobacteraceae bacterium]